MTRLSDFIQILLSLESPLNFLSTLLLIVIFLQCWKVAKGFIRLAWIGVKWGWSLRVKITVGRVIVWGCISAVICAFSAPISDGLQWMEQRYLVKSKDEEVTIKEWHTVKVSDCGKFVIN